MQSTHASVLVMRGRDKNSQSVLPTEAGANQTDRTNHHSAMLRTPLTTQWPPDIGPCKRFVRLTTWVGHFWSRYEFLIKWAQSTTRCYVHSCFFLRCSYMELPDILFIFILLSNINYFIDYHIRQMLSSQRIFDNRLLMINNQDLKP